MTRWFLAALICFVVSAPTEAAPKKDLSDEEREGILEDLIEKVKNAQRDIEDLRKDLKTATEKLAAAEALITQNNTNAANGLEALRREKVEYLLFRIGPAEKQGWNRGGREGDTYYTGIDRKWRVVGIWYTIESHGRSAGSIKPGESQHSNEAKFDPHWIEKDGLIGFGFRGIGDFAFADLPATLKIHVLVVPK